MLDYAAVHDCGIVVNPGRLAATFAQAGQVLEQRAVVDHGFPELLGARRVGAQVHGRAVTLHRAAMVDGQGVHGGGPVVDGVAAITHHVPDQHDGGHLGGLVAQLLRDQKAWTDAEKVLASAPDLVAIGAFCIGTNQIDLRAASGKGVAVFNAPYANTRSVVELAIGMLGMFKRKAEKPAVWWSGIVDVDGQKLNTKNVILAMGSVPKDLPHIKADGTVVEARGNEEIEYDGELHSAANLFDALKEGYYGKF